MYLPLNRKRGMRLSSDEAETVNAGGKGPETEDCGQENAGAFEDAVKDGGRQDNGPQGGIDPEEMEQWKKQRKKFRYIFRDIGILLAGVIILYVAVDNLSAIKGWAANIADILFPVIIGLVIAYILYPAANLMEKQFMKLFARTSMKETTVRKLSFGLGIAAVILLVIMVIVLLIVLVVPGLINNATAAIIALPVQLDGVTDAVVAFLSGYGFETASVEEWLDSITTYILDFIGGIMSNSMDVVITSITSGIISFVATIFDVIVGIVVAVYALAERRTFKRQISKLTYVLLPEQPAKLVTSIVDESNRIFINFFEGKIVDSIIMGILCFIVSSILQMPYAVLVSVVVGITNVIPFFGPFIGGIPCAVLIFLSDPIKGIVFAIEILALQQFDGNILGPRILGISVGISPFWIVFSILLFGGLFGIWGMLFGVPVFTVIYRWVSKFVEYMLERKGHPEKKADEQQQ